MRSLALILSMTAPVPPAHLSFIEGIFFLRPVSGSFLKMMILASCPPSSITEPHSGYIRSTASDTALTSWTNLAPRYLAMPLPPEPVMNIRDRAASKPSISVSKRLQELQHLLRLLGIVPLVILPENLVGSRIDHHGFYRGGTDIHADKEIFLHGYLSLARVPSAFMRSAMCSTKFAAPPTYALGVRHLVQRTLGFRMRFHPGARTGPA